MQSLLQASNTQASTIGEHSSRLPNRIFDLIYLTASLDIKVDPAAHLLKVMAGGEPFGCLAMAINTVPIQWHVLNPL
jgi:hypothetical protein